MFGGYRILTIALMYFFPFSRTFSTPSLPGKTHILQTQRPHSHQNNSDDIINVISCQTLESFLQSHRRPFCATVFTGCVVLLLMSKLMMLIIFSFTKTPNDMKMKRDAFLKYSDIS